MAMIKRRELLDQLGSSEPDLWLIEAGAGFGKSVLLDQLRSRLVLLPIMMRRPVGGVDLLSFLSDLAVSARRAGDADVAAAIIGLEGDVHGISDLVAESDRTLVVDDVQRWEPEVAEYLHDLVAGLSGRTPVIVAGRRVSGPIGSAPTARRLGPADLSFTESETAELLGDSGVDVDIAPHLHSMSGGWPLAVASAVVRLGQASDPIAVANELASHENLVDALLRSYVDDLAVDDLGAAQMLAHLPFFDDALADMMGSSGLLERLASAGIPITHRMDGWAEFADVVKNWLALASAASPVADRKVVQYLIKRGEIQAALTSCISAGDYSQAVHSLAKLDSDQQTRLDPSMVNALITMVGDTVAEAPRCLFVQNQVNVSYGRMHDGDRALERAIELYAVSDPTLMEHGHMEALLEQAIADLYEDRLDEAMHALQRCEARKPKDMAIRARMHDVRGLHHQQQATEVGLNAAKVECTEALRIWRSLADTRPATVTAFRLATVLTDLGLRTEALELLDTLPTLGPTTIINRARVGLERTLLLPYLGRASEVEGQLSEPRRIASLLGYEWLTAWSFWAEIIAASILNDGPRVVRLVDDYIAAEHFLINDMTQAGMWSEVAEALARCGEGERAQQALDRALSHYDEPWWLFDAAAVSVAARCGEPHAALEGLHRLDAREDLDVERRWRTSFLIAYVEWRVGDAESSAEYLAEAYRRAAELGQPTLPDIVEAQLVAVMSGDQPASDQTGVLELRLFGGFALAVNGVAVDIPRGQVRDVFKLLVFGGRRVMVDQVIDAFWPEADMEVGKRRLRNVLRRLRKACGDVVVRSGDSLLLVSGAASDYGRAVAAATQCEGPDCTLSLLGEAIELNQGDLLPEDLYSDWVQDERRVQTQRLVELLDAQAVLAQEAGDIDLAVAALRRAEKLDAKSGHRLAIAAVMLREAGRDGAAHAIEAERQ